MLHRVDCVFYKSMIIDCFTFFNECDILEGRLEYLYDSVDYFVIVEANLTFSGNEKQFVYPQNLNRFRKYADKILYYPMSILKSEFLDFKNDTNLKSQGPAWEIEFKQRNRIGWALKIFDPNAIAIVGDIDEIPNRDCLNDAVQMLNFQPAVSLHQQVLVYNLDNIQYGDWFGSVITRAGIVSTLSAQHCRDKRWNEMNHVANGGWHLTYWGGVDQVRYKIQSFSHQEGNHPDFTEPEMIQKRMDKGLHPFEAVEKITNGFTNAYSSQGHLPQDFVDVFSKYIK